ncbi:MAG: helix-turn-helix transcriptional regulator [Candidatus Hydrogenedentes bacterium]|nr:helix-turn-helix transcriptional regulator [Candidatus Hydrogenedentota bacterium]
MNVKGALPTLILQVLLGGPLHGYRIAQEIKKRSKGVLEFREGTLYPALHDLENRGLITSEEIMVKGRPRRDYRLTDAGRGILLDEREEWRRYVKAVDLVLGEG